MPVIEARGLHKTFGRTTALEHIDLEVSEGRIVGLLGPNGAGKSTLLFAILGLTPCEGSLRVLGLDPWTQRDQLMRDVAFIADVSTLPRWMRVSQALDFMTGVHPRFSRSKAEAFLRETTIRNESKISELSKGMVMQLHLALILSIDAKLVVLDEPTLGLDVAFRKHFYDSLLGDYCDGKRTIVISTHEVDDIQNLVTEAVFLARGRVALNCGMEELEARFAEVLVNADRLEAARSFHPVSERRSLNRSIFLFDLSRSRTSRQELSQWGEARTPSVSDLLIALVSADAASNRRPAQ